MNNIETERLAISLLDCDNIADIHDMFIWHNDNEMIKYLHSDVYNTESSFRCSLLGGKNIFIAKLKDGGDQVVCYCRVGHSVIYACNPKYRGNGYTAEMLSAIINTLGLRNVIARIDCRNIASQKVAEKAGFVRIPLTQNQTMYEYIHRK